MSVHWTPLAVGVPFPKAEEIQKRLEGAGIAFLPAEATSWIGKLRAFIDNSPDISLFVDKEDVDRAMGLIKGIFDTSTSEQSIESYVATLSIEQLKRLLASPGWPDLVRDPAQHSLNALIMPPAPESQSSAQLPLFMGALAAILGPLGSWISRQVIPQAVPWDDKMIPVYDEPTRTAAQSYVKIGQVVFLVWFLPFFVVKCFR